jgi:hypothetical protein
LAIGFKNDILQFRHPLHILRRYWLFQFHSPSFQSSRPEPDNSHANDNRPNAACPMQPCLPDSIGIEFDRSFRLWVGSRKAELMLRQFILSVGLCASIPGVGFGQNAKWSCETSPDVQGEIDSLNDSYGPLGHEPEAERLARLRQMMSAHPEDPFVRLAYAVVLRSRTVSGREAAVEELRKLATAESAGSWPKMVYASSQYGVHTRDSIRILEAVSSVTPEFPAAHSLLGSIYTKPAFRDNAKFETHQSALLGLCPDTLASYENLRSAEKSDLLRDSATRLRELIGTRKDRKAVASYRLLWTLEFKIGGADTAALRKRVGEDIDRVKGLSPDEVPEITGILAEGYKLAGDTAQGKKHEIARYDRMPGMRTPHRLSSRGGPFKVATE